MPSTAFIGAVAFVFGLTIGSFLNVCILRIPAGKSIVSPPSACPKCGKPIKPWDNIPVLSYLILRGRCRACGTRISPMYPAVELLTGILFLLTYLAFGISLATIKWSIFAAIIVVLVFTDLRERILPDAVNFTGLALGLLISLFTPPSDGTALWLANRVFAFPPPRPAVSFADAVLGAAARGPARTDRHPARRRVCGRGAREREEERRATDGRREGTIDDETGRWTIVYGLPSVVIRIGVFHV